MSNFQTELDTVRHTADAITSFVNSILGNPVIVGILGFIPIVGAAIPEVKAAIDALDATIDALDAAMYGANVTQESSAAPASPAATSTSKVSDLAAATTALHWPTTLDNVAKARALIAPHAPALAAKLATPSRSILTEIIGELAKL